MSPQRRNILLVLLGTVVFGYFSYDLYERFYSMPLEKEVKQELALEKRLKDSKLQLKKLDNKIPQREVFEQRSLPATAEIATSAYQAWLLNLVTRLGLVSPTVDSSSPIDDGDLTRLQFSVKGKASLKQLTQFLFEFYQAGHLQKINQITLTPTAKGERLDILVNIEALALRRAVNEQGLTQEIGNRLVHSSIDPYLAIASRNLFGENEVPQILSTTRLTAITRDRLGRQEAWFTTVGKKKSQIVTEGQTLELSTLTAKVISIDSDALVIEIEGTAATLRLGKSLAELDTLSQLTQSSSTGITAQSKAETVLDR